MTDKEFENRWKQMQVDADYLLWATEYASQFNRNTIKNCAESLMFAAKLLRVYDKNLRAAIKSNIELRKENSRLKAYIKGVQE